MVIFRRLFISGVLLVAHSVTDSASAQESRFVIKTLQRKEHRATVKISTDQTQVEISPQADLIASFEGGKQCSLRVVSVTQRLAVVDTSTCAFERKLKEGQTLGLSIDVDVTPERPKSEQDLDSEAALNSVDVPSSPHEISDLQFIPREKQWAANLSYLMSRTDETAYNSASDQVSEGHTNSQAVSVGLQYGYNNDLSFNVSVLVYPSWDQELLDNSTGSIDRMSASGLADPSFGVKYRLIEQMPYAVNFDLGASYSPKLMNAEQATSRIDGNMARGGDLLKLHAELGHKFSILSYVIGVSYELVGPATSTDPDTLVDDKASGYNVLAFRFAGQLQISKMFLLDAELSERFRSSRSRSAPTLETRFESYHQLSLGASLWAYLIPQRLALRLDYMNDLKTRIGVYQNRELTTEPTSEQFAVNVVGSF